MIKILDRGLVFYFKNKKFIIRFEKITERIYNYLILQSEYNYINFSKRFEKFKK